MSAKTDLDAAIALLDLGIAAHVNALQAARALAVDETFVVDATAKITALTTILNQSTAGGVSAV